jgi:hypothetical protein
MPSGIAKVQPGLPSKTSPRNRIARPTQTTRANRNARSTNVRAAVNRAARSAAAARRGPTMYRTNATLLAMAAPAAMSPPTNIVPATIDSGTCAQIVGEFLFNCDRQVTRAAEAEGTRTNTWWGRLFSEADMRSAWPPQTRRHRSFGARLLRLESTAARVRHYGGVPGRLLANSH